VPGKDHGPSVKDPELYERLREEGDSKEKAARIANQAANEGRSSVGERGGHAENYEDRAQKIGIDGHADMNKDELVDALRNH
jgi:hypothetical protein